MWNKESLVTCGRLFMEAVQQSGARLLPVDSEHNAIFQSMPETIQQHLGYADLARNGVSSILLTGSGGPFRETAVAELAAMTPDQACLSILMFRVLPKRRGLVKRVTSPPVSTNCSMSFVLSI